MRHVEYTTTILLGIFEASILYRGVTGRLPGLRISKPPSES